MAKNNSEKPNVFLNIGEIEKSAEILAPYFLSPRKFIETFVMISKKDGTFGKMLLNKAQDIVMKEVERRLQANIPVRVRILKSRQQGMTAFCVALGMWWACTHENASYAVVAHKEFSASSIYERARMIFTNFPEEIRPMTSKFNSDKITLDAGFGEMGGFKSRVFFGTAGCGELFRGETINFLHKSEKAFWDDPNGVLDKSLNATVPKMSNTFIFDETTANGYNRFKDEWDRSVRGENDYTAIFLPWFLSEEYAMTPPPDFILTDKEKELALVYDLTDEQIYWRRYTIANDFEGRELFFDQEYPISPEVAFIASGFGVFGGDLIREGYEGVAKPLREMDIEGMVVNPLIIFEEPEILEEVEYGDRVVFSEEQQKYIHESDGIIVGKTIRKGNYTIGIDTSGLGMDWNIISVWHNTKKKQVAVWRQRTLKEELIAEVAMKIGQFYNNALIASETNFSHAIYDFLEKGGYKNLYIREDTERIDKTTQGLRYGWHTSNKSKTLIISTLKSRLSENPRAIVDKEFWYEAEYYILEDVAKNVMNASSGHHDDNIIANAIACYVCNSFQAKQHYSLVTQQDKPKTNIEMERFLGYTKKNKGKVKLRKGVYKNNA